MTPKTPLAAMNSLPWESEFTVRLAEKFGSEIEQFSSYNGQNFLVCAPTSAIRILEHLKIEEEFDFLVDVTAVDYPDRERRFELVYIVYSYPRNERIRIKTQVAIGEKPDSAVPVHLTANWLEREIFDLFGIEFAGHPDMRRILLPDEWQGHPLRRDYSILQMDNEWVQENLGISSGQ